MVGRRGLTRDVGAREVDFHSKRHDDLLLMCSDKAIASQNLLDATCDRYYERFNNR